MRREGKECVRYAPVKNRKEKGERSIRMNGRKEEWHVHARVERLREGGREGEWKGVCRVNLSNSK
jgi:hypothetical protein